jgi:hypothetical protein
MVPDPAPPYEVGMSQSLRERIDRLSHLAAVRGISDAFDGAVDRIMGMLRMTPRESGDPIRHLRGLSMTQYRIYHGGLIADYSIHDRIPMIALWSLVPGPSHPLAPPPTGNGT